MKIDGLIFFCFVIICQLTIAQDTVASLRHYVMPIRSDNDWLMSDLVLTVSGKDYNPPLIYNGNQETVGEETVVVDFLNALKEGSSERLSAMATSDNQKYVLDMMKFLRSTLYKAKTEIVRQLYLGNQKLFMCRLSIDKKSNYFYINLREEEGVFRCYPPGLTERIVSSVLTNYHQLLKKSSSVPVIDKLPIHELVLETDDNSINQVRIFFEGYRLSGINVYEEHQHEIIEPIDSAVDFFHHTRKVLRDQTPTDYAKLFTEQSGRKYNEWINFMTEQMFSDYRTAMVEQGCVLHYVIKALPFYIFFYNDKNGKAYPYTHMTGNYNS